MDRSSPYLFHPAVWLPQGLKYLLSRLPVGSPPRRVVYVTFLYVIVSDISAEPGSEQISHPSFISDVVVATSSCVFHNSKAKPISYVWDAVALFLTCMTGEGGGEIVLVL